MRERVLKKREGEMREGKRERGRMRLKRERKLVL